MDDTEAFEGSDKLFGGGGGGMLLEYELPTL